MSALNSTVGAGGSGWGAQHLDGSEQWLQLSEGERQASVLSGGRRVVAGNAQAGEREQQRDVLSQYARWSAPEAHAGVSVSAPAAAVVAPAAPPVAAPAPAPASSSAQEQAEVAQMQAVWSGHSQSDPYRVFQQMHEHGWSAARLANAVGSTEQDIANFLIRLGAPAGFASTLTLSREALNADYLQQLQAAQAGGKWMRTVTVVDESGHAVVVDESGTVATRQEFDALGFTQSYLTQDTPQAKQFALIHGAVQADPLPDGTSGGVRFASGLSWNAGTASWAGNDRVAKYISQPRASDEQLLATAQEWAKPLNQEVLRQFGGQETLPNNDVGETMRARYGTELGTELLRLDRATQAARSYYGNELDKAIRGESTLGWKDGPSTVDEAGVVHTSKTFDEVAFHQELLAQKDEKSQLMGRLFAQASLSDSGELVVQGEGGALKFGLGRDESGMTTSAAAVSTLPAGLTKVDIAAPPSMFDSTQVYFMVGVGFVTMSQNIKPPKKKKSWLKTVLTVVAVVAVSVFTAGTAAPALLGAMGTAMGTTIAAGSLAGAMITGAMVGAATTLTSGLIMNGKIDLKAMAKGALVGGITGGVMNQLEGAAAFKEASKAAQVGARMVVQGGLQEASGGDFKTGALAALGQGLSQGAQDLTKSLGNGVSKAIGKVVEAGVSGGGNAEGMLEALAKSYLGEAVGNTVKGWLPPVAAVGAGTGLAGATPNVPSSGSYRNGSDIESDDAAGRDHVNGMDVESDRQAELNHRNGLDIESDAVTGRNQVNGMDIASDWTAGRYSINGADLQDDLAFKAAAAQGAEATLPPNPVPEDNAADRAQAEANARASFRELERAYREVSDTGAAVRRGDVLERLAGGDKELMGRYIAGMKLSDPNQLRVGQRLSANWDISPTQARAVADHFYAADGRAKLEQVTVQADRNEQSAITAAQPGSFNASLSSQVLPAPIHKNPDVTSNKLLDGIELTYRQFIDKPILRLGSALERQMNVDWGTQEKLDYSASETDKLLNKSYAPESKAGGNSGNMLSYSATMKLPAAPVGENNYDSSNLTYHRYDLEVPLCYRQESFCTIPNLSPLVNFRSAPLQSWSEGMQNGEQILVGGSPINHFSDFKEGVFINQTQSGHPFHAGNVESNLYWKGDLLHLGTVGYGYGATIPHTAANYAVGVGYFGAWQAGVKYNVNRIRQSAAP